jgi:hypothetical protein
MPIDAGNKGPERWDERREKRNPLIKMARITFDAVVLDGVVLNISSGGARIYLPVKDTVPEQVLLHLPDGVTRPARLRWQHADEIGLEFIPVATTDKVRQEHAWAACRAARDADLTEVVRFLQSGEFFNDDELRQAALEAEAAYARLIIALRRHVLVPSTVSAQD